MKLYKLFALALLSFALAGCDEGIDLIDVENTVYIPQSGYSQQTVLLGESTHYLTIYKAGLPESPAIDVTVDVDEEAFEKFKADNPAYASYTLLPSDYYSFETKTLDIPSDKAENLLKIKMKGIDESFTDTKYILPVAIKSVSQGKINEEKSVAFLHFSRYRNAYEGRYRAQGTSTGSNGSTENVDTDKKELTTSGVRSVIANVANSGDIKMNLEVAEDGTVTVTSAPGSEAYSVWNDTEKSTYEGSFDPFYQRNKGVFKLHYTYEIVQVVESVTITTTYHVSEELTFWL